MNEIVYAAIGRVSENGENWDIGLMPNSSTWLTLHRSTTHGMVPKVGDVVGIEVPRVVGFLSEATPPKKGDTVKIRVPETYRIKEGQHLVTDSILGSILDQVRPHEPLIQTPWGVSTPTPSTSTFNPIPPLETTYEAVEATPHDPGGAASDLLRAEPGSGLPCADLALTVGSPAPPSLLGRFRDLVPVENLDELQRDALESVAELLEDIEEWPGVDLHREDRVSIRHAEAKVRRLLGHG